MAAHLFYLDFPNDIPDADASYRVSVFHCKPCANPHDSCDLSRFLPAELASYALDNYTTMFPPCRVAKDDVSVPIDRLEVEKNYPPPVRARPPGMTAPSSYYYLSSFLLSSSTLTILILV